MAGTSLGRMMGVVPRGAPCSPSSLLSQFPARHGMPLGSLRFGEPGRRPLVPAVLFRRIGDVQGLTEGGVQGVPHLVLPGPVPDRGM